MWIERVFFKFLVNNRQAASVASKLDAIDMNKIFNKYVCHQINSEVLISIEEVIYYNDKDQWRKEDEYFSVVHKKAYGFFHVVLLLVCVYV